MADSVCPTLTTTELRCVLDVLADVLTTPTPPITPVAGDDGATVAAYFKLAHTRLMDAGWRPQSIHLAAWAVEALARILVPPPPAKPAPKKRIPEKTRARKRRGRPRTRPVVADRPDDGAPDGAELRAHDFPELGEAPTS